MRHLRYPILCFALATFSPLASAQTVEELRCDTATLHALFIASVKETRKKLYGDMGPNLVRVTALPARSGSKQDSCTKECVTFMEWPRAWTDALGLTTVPIDSSVDQRVFIKRPVFRSTKTCVVPYYHPDRMGRLGRLSGVPEARDPMALQARKDHGGELWFLVMRKGRQLTALCRMIGYRTFTPSSLSLTSTRGSGGRCARG